jgi:uncharacterized protein
MAPAYPDSLAERISEAGLRARCLDLEARLRGMPSVLIGFSGGADSALLTAMARRVLGRGRVKACLAVGPSLPSRELRGARSLAASLDVELAEYPATEFANPAYVANGPDRCYHCKADLFAHLEAFAAAARAGLDRSAAADGPVLLYGGNLDDTYDYRPGRKAAEDSGARAPLAEAGLSKADVRALSRALGLPTAEKPALPCLSSRIPYGQAVTLEKLAAVEAGEEALAALGFREGRLRHYGDIARIEVPGDQLGLLDEGARASLEARLRELGFARMEIDPAGFRSGRLNQSLSREELQRFSERTQNASSRIPKSTPNP